MAQTNYTPISLYYSTTASAVPTAANLVPGELAINTADGKLYYEDSAGVVQVLATKSTGSIGGSNTQVQFNNSGSLGGSSSFTWDGTTVTATKFAGALNGTVGATTASTGAFTTLSATGVATFSAGTVSLPAITTTGDTNTGIYFPAADTIAFTEGGAESMRIDSSGNVGIGTSSPEAFAGFTTLQVQGTGTTTGGAFQTTTSDSSVKARFVCSSNGGLLNVVTNHPMLFNTNNTERMRIDSSGNLLIGKTSATANGGDLQVSSGITFPATQVAKSDANTLDDYEEGDWTPTQGAGLTVVGAFTSAGRYTKIGRDVFVTGYVQGATSISLASGGAVLAGGLPFTGGGSAFYYCGSATNSNANTGIVIMAYAGLTNIYSAGTLTTTGGNLQFTVTYQV